MEKLEVINPPELDQLHFLHDAEVSEIKYFYDLTDDLNYIEIRCHTGIDNEPAELDNLSLLLRFEGVITVLGQLNGYQLGKDQLDFIAAEVSTEFTSSITHLVAAGIGVPPLLLIVVFGSGSQLEIACNAVTVEAIQSDIQPVC